MKMQNSLVSIIVLSWNRANLLGKTIESLLNQTYQNFEILIIDNESTDNTEIYVNSIKDNRIRFFRNANNGVLSVNRNFGIKHAKGNFIAFCDDDDIWLPSKLKDQMDFLLMHPEFNAVSTNGVYFNEGGDIGRLIKRASGEITLEDFLKAKNYVILSSVLFNANIFSKIGLYNENPDIVSTEDYEFLVRTSKYFRLYFINKCLVKYRVHALMHSHKNSLTTINKEKILFAGLHNNKILNDDEYGRIHRNLRKKYTLAKIKELFKKIKFVKNLVYMTRRMRYRLNIGR